MGNDSFRLGGRESGGMGEGVSYESTSTRRYKKLKKKYCRVGIVLLGLVGIVLGIYYGKGGTSSSQQDNEKQFDTFPRGGSWSCHQPWWPLCPTARRPRYHDKIKRQPLTSYYYTPYCSPATRMAVIGAISPEKLKKKLCGWSPPTYCIYNNLYSMALLQTDVAKQSPPK